jgi:L-fuculose-phosphate aldolase
MANEADLRDEIVEAGKRLYFKDLVAACDGNISARLGPGEYLVTPSGVSKGFFAADDILKVDSAGNLVSGHGKPTRELSMHLGIYEARPDINGIVHAHPPIATAFGSTDYDFSRVLLPEIVFELGSIVVAEYALPTTDGVIRSIMRVLTDTSNAVLLANHGAVTLGPTVLQAYFNMETLEAVAKITLAAGQVGTPRFLSPAQVSELRKYIEPDAVEPHQPQAPHSAADAELIQRVVDEVFSRLTGG